jgi:hypothetical protein
MALSPFLRSRQSLSHSKISQLLWNPKVNCRLHKSPPLVPILSQIDPVHTTLSYLRPILMLSSLLRLDLPSGLLPSGFHMKPLYGFLFLPYVLHHSNYISRNVQVVNLLIMQLSSNSYYFIYLRSRYSPQHLVLEHSHFVFSL